MPVEAYQIHALLKAPPEASVVVTAMPEVARRHLGARQHNVYLSRDTLLKIKRRHPSIDYIDLTWAPEILAHGTLLAEPPPSKSIAAVYMFERTGKIYKVVVKLSRSGHDMWLTAFHRLEPNQVLRLMNGSQILRYSDRML